MRTSISTALSVIFLIAVAAAPASGDELKEGMSWGNVTSKGQSLVFGRLEGQFDGPDFRDRKLELRRVESGKTVDISVGEGLGYFEAVIPPGSYEVLAVEATYFPPGRPMDPTRYRPVRQRFGVHPKPTESMALPAIHVPADRPVYVGTVRVDNLPDGIVYRGHYIRVVDEYEEAFERLASQFPQLASSLSRASITPARHYMLKPRPPERPLDIIEVEDPIRRARDYIAEGKFQQAINWLRTFMPTSDEERNEARLLIGEAMLGDGNYMDAIDRLGSALQADPENHRALRLLARAHLYNKDVDDAMNLYGALAEAMPGDAEANLTMGYLYALRSESLRSAQAFDSAFRYDHDYLLYDVAPFATVLNAVKQESAEYVPPRVVRHRVRPPRDIQSRRSARGGLALVIDHTGRVVAARVAPEGGGSLSAMMLAMIRATFKPASVNGVAVPSLLLMGGDWSDPSR